MKYQLVINVQDDGSVNVTGPVGNENLCHDILFMALKAIRQHNSEPPSLIQPVNRIKGL